MAADKNIRQITKISFFQTEDWIQQIDRELSRRNSTKRINQLICCFVPGDDVTPRQLGGQLRCRPKRKKKSTADCVSDLIYSVRVNKKLGKSKIARNEDPGAILSNLWHQCLLHLKFKRNQVGLSLNPIKDVWRVSHAKSVILREKYFHSKLS